MRYQSAASFRQAIDTRLRAKTVKGADPMRLRHAIVFERVLARLVHEQPDRWVLKGGVALEARLADRARATRDLDLAVRHAVEDEQALRELIVGSLASDPDDDWFRLSLVQMRDISADEAGRPGWRLTVRANLDAREFASVHVDVVARTDEIIATETIVLPSSLSFAGIPGLEVEAVDRTQHFAEKLHAYTLERGSRENTRVKDFTDLVLLTETGLEPTRRLHEVVAHVFTIRGTHTVPEEIPQPPSAWRATYASQAASIHLGARTMGDGHRRVQEFWVATKEEVS